MRPRSRTSHSGRFQAITAVGAFFIVLALMFAGSILLAFVAYFGSPSGDAATDLQALLSPEFLVVQIAFSTLLLGGAALGFARLLGENPVRYLGLGGCRPAMLAISVVGVVGAGLIADEVLFLLHANWPAAFDTGGLEALNESFAIASLPAFVAITAAVTIGPGIGEELFFRGLMLRALGAAVSRPVAVVAAGLFFGAMHMNLLQGTGTTLIGIFLGCMAVLAKSIWPAVLGHAINNFLCALVARFDTQGAAAAWREGHPPWLIALAATVVALSIAAATKVGSVPNAARDLRQPE